MKAYEFTAQGHPSILANHTKTLEITKDTDLTKRGDCIVGIRADFVTKELKKFNGWCYLTISFEDISQRFKFLVNPTYSSNNDLVLRKSKFESNRTFGFKLDKGSNKLKPDLLKILQDGETVNIKIEEKQKNKPHINKYKSMIAL